MGGKGYQTLMENEDINTKVSNLFFVLSFPVEEPPPGTCAIAWAHRQNTGEKFSCSIENIISFLINIFCPMRIAPASKFSGSF